MSMRLGTSMTFRTRPRCLRMRKFDWMTLAIAAPDLFVAASPSASQRLGHAAAHAANGKSLRGAGNARWPGVNLGSSDGDGDLSRKFGPVKQKARRRGTEAYSAEKIVQTDGPARVLRAGR